MRTKHLWVLVILLIGCTSPTSEVAPDTVPLQGPLPFHMETFAYNSINTGHSYNIYVSLPLNYQIGNKLEPTIYVLDGDIMFGTAKEVVHALSLGGEMEDSIVVGIGYEFDTVEKLFELRERDLEPPSPGYEAFTLFLLEELIPYIDSNYSTDVNKRTLLGHSLGGIFSLNVMFRSPDSFNRIIASSPSLQVNDRGIFLLEEEYAKDNRELPVKLYLSVGSLEGDKSDFLDFSTILESREYSGFSLDVEVIEGENHMSVMPFSISKGFRAMND